MSAVTAPSQSSHLGAALGADLLLAELAPHSPGEEAEPGLHVDHLVELQVEGLQG